MSDERDPNKLPPGDPEGAPMSRSALLLTGTLGLVGGAWLSLVSWYASTRPPNDRPIPPHVALGVVSAILIVGSVVCLVRGLRR